MEAVHTDDLRGQILWRLHKFQCELANGFETDGRTVRLVMLIKNIYTL